MLSSAPEQAGCDSRVRPGAVTNISGFPRGPSERGRAASCIGQLVVLCGKGAWQQFWEGRRSRGCGDTQERRFKWEKFIERNLKLPQSVRGHGCKAEGEREEGGMRKKKE